MFESLFALLSSLCIWPCIIALPLLLTYNNFYSQLFSIDDYKYDIIPHDYFQNSAYPSSLGLTLGLVAVIIGQVVVLMYTSLWYNGVLFGIRIPVQKEGPPKYDYLASMKEHLSQPEGFAMIGGYLISTWMFGLMPKSYYSFSGGINWKHVLLQLLIQDAVQYCMHYLEHKLSPQLYRASHKPHHRFTNPKLFDAFNGSPADTFLMIIVPFVITARLVNANVWSYMTFGSLYANWLTLIHAEYVHPWDFLFRCIGFGTSADHHVHHKLFVYNYGHLFMYWDKLFGTYKSPRDVSIFNSGV
eukprot:gene8844-11935_t